MILPRDRALARILLRLGLFRLEAPSFANARCYRLRARFGAKWLWRRMRERQTSDGLHHAPCCPGNEWSGAELVIHGCTCGANREAPAG